MRLTAGPLGSVLRDSPFRNFWVAFTISGVGDAMTKTALIWYVLQRTGSATDVGLLLLAYAGPVAIGGIVAGYLLDRVDRRRLMLTDSLIRGVAVASVPAAFALGVLGLWQVYLVAAIYGLLFMISLAGTPSVIPSLVRPENLSAANSLETLGFTVSAVAGPALAGFLIAGIGAPYVLWVDAASYFIFALALATMRLRPEPIDKANEALAPSYRMMDAVRLLVGNSVLLATTLMFMSFNVGEGFLAVWLPVDATALSPAHGAELYGILLTVQAAGETVGALASGVVPSILPLGRLICLTQVLAGLGLTVILLGRGLWTAAPALFLLGFFSSPMTAWAQTLRMQIIPAPLRGRSFALLRTLMQASGPAASAIGGALLPAAGLTAMMGLSAVMIGAPGIVGSRVHSLVGKARQGMANSADVNLGSGPPGTET